MNKFELQLKRDGHHKAANFWEKKGKRAGKNSEAYKKYLYHVEKWLEYNAQTKT